MKHMESKEMWILSEFLGGNCWAVGKTKFVKFAAEEIGSIRFRPNLWYEFKREDVSLHASKSAAVVSFVVAHPTEDLFELVEPHGAVVVTRRHDGTFDRFSESWSDEQMSKRYKKV